MITSADKDFYALLLLFEFGLIGVFSALDLFIFYIFWEVALVPMYLMVGVVGWRAPRTGSREVLRVYDARLRADARLHPLPA